MTKKPSHAQLNLVSIAIARMFSTEPIEPGTYRLEGRATIELDAHLTKGIRTVARARLKQDELLEIALVLAGIPRHEVAGLITEVKKEVENQANLREPVEHEGPIKTSGTIAIAGWKGR